MAFAQQVDHTASHDMHWPLQTCRLYRSMALAEMNGILYKIICYVNRDGPYAFMTDDHVPAPTMMKLKAIHRSCRVDIFYVAKAMGTVYVMKYMPCYKTCGQCLGIVQRAARRWRDNRRSKRALAVAMALHKRLGQNSTIHCVQEDIVRLVCAYL